MRACPRERSQFEGRLDDVTNHMLDGEMQLLDSRRLVGRNHETLVDQLARGAFFFSSRRRHPRSLRDWSSDVCSSDLAESVRLMTRDRMTAAERAESRIFVG